MDSVLSLLDALGALPLSGLWQPEAWLEAALHRTSLWWALIALGVGVLIRTAGHSRFFFKLVLAGLFAGIFYTVGPMLGSLFPAFSRLAAQPIHLVWMGLVCAALTPLAVFLLAGVVGGWICGKLITPFPFSHTFIPGGLIVGALALAFRDLVAWFVAGFIGSLLIVAAVVRFLSAAGLGDTFLRHPDAVVFSALGLAAAGAALRRRGHD